MKNKTCQPKSGDTIAIIAPSSSSPPELLAAAVAYFKKEGFKVKTGKHINHHYSFTAGTDQERAEDIMTFFKDPDISSLIVTRGGVGSITTLPLLDFDIIQKNPKPIVGFSDTTALQLGINTKTNLISYTGFSCSDVYQKSDLDPLIHETLFKCLSQQDYTIQQGTTINPGKVTAPLIGGNLMTLIGLMGTAYQPTYNNKILLLEDASLEPYLIEGLFSQLYVAGIFDQVAGVIFGTFSNCDAVRFQNQGECINDILDRWSEKIQSPCIADFPYGHIDSRSVLPIGIDTTLDADNCSLTIHFDGIK